MVPARQSRGSSCRLSANCLDVANEIHSECLFIARFGVFSPPVAISDLPGGRSSIRSTRCDRDLRLEPRAVFIDRDDVVAVINLPATQRRLATV
jgi:hypothetical protein